MDRRPVNRLARLFGDISGGWQFVEVARQYSEPFDRIEWWLSVASDRHGNTIIGVERADLFA